MIKVKALTTDFYVRINKPDPSMLIDVHLKWANIHYGILKGNIDRQNQETDEEYALRQYSTMLVYIHDILFTLCLNGCIVVETNHAKVCEYSVRALYNFDETEEMLRALSLRIMFPSLADAGSLWMEILNNSDLKDIDKSDDISVIISKFVFGTIMETMDEQVEQGKVMVSDG